MQNIEVFTMPADYKEWLESWAPEKAAKDICARWLKAPRGYTVGYVGTGRTKQEAIEDLRRNSLLRSEAVIM